MLRRLTVLGGLALALALGAGPLAAQDGGPPGTITFFPDHTSGSYDSCTDSVTVVVAFYGAANTTYDLYLYLVASDDGTDGGANWGQIASSDAEAATTDATGYGTCTLICAGMALPAPGDAGWAYKVVLTPSNQDNQLAAHDGFVAK